LTFEGLCNPHISDFLKLKKTKKKKEGRKKTRKRRSRVGFAGL